MLNLWLYSWVLPVSLARKLFKEDFNVSWSFHANFLYRVLLIFKNHYIGFFTFITFLLCRMESRAYEGPWNTKSRARIRSVLWATGKEKFRRFPGNVYGISSILQVAEERYFRFVMRGGWMLLYPADMKISIIFEKLVRHPRNSCFLNCG